MRQAKANIAIMLTAAEKLKALREQQALLADILGRHLPVDDGITDALPTGDPHHVGPTPTRADLTR